MGKFDHVRVGVGLAIVKPNTNIVLMQKRISEHQDGTWCFPGGHMELWETFAETAKREANEECGPDLKFTDPTFWTTVNTPYPKEGRHYVVVLMRAEYISGEAVVMETDKCECWDWFHWHSLPSPLILGCQIVKDRLQIPYPSNGGMYKSDYYLR